MSEELSRIIVAEEAMRFVTDNHGTKVGNYSYNSPRISSEIADCSMPMTFDNYSSCSLGCLYCFAYSLKTNNPGKIGKAQKLDAVNVPDMIRTMQGNPKGKHGALFHKYFYSKKFLLHWGGLADPFCNFEKANGVSLELIKELGEMNYPTLFSFKGDTVFQPEYVKVFEKYAHQKNFAFQVSIITANARLAKDIEIGVPSPSRRIAAIKLLSDMGYWTILRLRPFIIGISDDMLDELLGRSLEAGIRGISTEFFAMDSRCNAGMATRFDWIGKHMGVKDVMEYYRTLSPAERGGNMRLNRLVKERYAKKLYTFCRQHGLVLGISDPDFKELCTSGSCCAMPDSFSENTGLENWTRDQLTYHIKEARKEYHTTGVLRILTFDGVYNSKSSPYLDETGLSNDHVGVIGRNYAERGNLTQKFLLQEQWNNLRSPANPRNYFHGKLMPYGVDTTGNRQFIYAPMSYEKRWKDEGIDLTY